MEVPDKSDKEARQRWTNLEVGDVAPEDETSKQIADVPSLILQEKQWKDV
jgi:hypothetical protein